MNTKKLARLNELIKRELGTIIEREFEHGPHQFITVTEVVIGEDLLHAVVKVSIWPDKDREQIFDNIEKAAGFLQQFLNKRLKMHPVPKVTFKLDTRIVEAARVEQLLENVKNE